VQTILQTPSPVAYVTTDGSLIYAAPSNPGTYARQSSLEQWMWPTVALLGLVAIIGSIAWAYSKQRHKRYMDLKDTEMAMQQRHSTPP
jgi:hypothetical protein